MSDERSVDKELAREIVEYCLRNPQAAGDLEDFVRWRLREAQVPYHLNETKKALDWLVAQGLLAADLAGPASIFSLNADRRTEAEQFVLGASRSPSQKEDL